MNLDADALQAVLRPAHDPPGEEVLLLPPLSALPSGRTLRLLQGGRSELLEIRSPGGAVELKVRLTDEGPVLEFDAARLDLRASGEVQVACDTFAVRARESIDLRTEGEVHVCGEGDVHVDGENVLLNCGPR